MFTLEITNEEYEGFAIRIGFAQPELSIGWRSSHDLVLRCRDGVRRLGHLHARLFVRNGRVFVLDAGTTNGTAINGHRFEFGHREPLEEGDRISIAERWVFTFEPWIPSIDRSPDATRLIEAIAAGDVASRAVYADLLEAQGEHERAEFARILDEPDRPAAWARVEELASNLPLAWRFAASQRLGRCLSCEHRCRERRWIELAAEHLVNGQRVDGECIRFSAPCGQKVSYCVLVSELRRERSRAADAPR